MHEELTAYGPQPGVFYDGAPSVSGPHLGAPSLLLTQL